MGIALWTVIVVAVVGFIVVVLVWQVRMHRRDSSPADAAFAARIVLGLAIVGATLSAISTAVAVLQTAIAREVQVTVPVAAFMPPVDARVFDLQGATAEALGSSPGFTDAVLNVVGLDAWARSLLAVGHAVNGAVIVTLLVLVAGLARQAMQQEPFARPLSARLAAGGAALAIGSLIWQAAFGVGGSLASAQVFGADSWASTGVVSTRYADAGLADTGLPLPTVAFEIEFWPIGAGLALIVVAGLMRSAERLQRETAGLV